MKPPSIEGVSRRSWVYGYFDTGSHFPIESAANAGVIVRSEFLDFSSRRDTPITGLRSGQHTVHARKQRLYVPDEQQTSLKTPEPPDMLHLRLYMRSTHTDGAIVL